MKRFFVALVSCMMAGGVFNVCAETKAPVAQEVQNVNLPSSTSTITMYKLLNYRCGLYPRTYTWEKTIKSMLDSHYCKPADVSEFMVIFTAPFHYRGIYPECVVGSTFQTSSYNFKMENEEQAHLLYDCMKRDLVANKAKLVEKDYDNPYTVNADYNGRNILLFVHEGPTVTLVVQ